MIRIKKKSADVFTFKDGIAIRGDCCAGDTIVKAKKYLSNGQVPLLLLDPPYGNIVNEKWDRSDNVTAFVAWMMGWTQLYATHFLLPQGAMYVWGGIGRPNFRPFFRYILDVEADKKLTLASLITWSKKRAYGVQNNYLFTREECAYFCKGDPKKPIIFNVPLTDVLRGYEGYDENYKAKSAFLRRTNVWTDITEMFKGKVHPTQKPVALMKVPIQVHTNKGDTVIDMFAGSGSTALAARELGRKFVVIEKDPTNFDVLVERIRKG